MMAPGLGVICAFIGVKLLLRGSGAVEVPAGLSVLVVAAVLLATVLAGTIADRAPSRAAMLERRFAVIDTDGNGVWQRDDGQLLTRRLRETLDPGEYSRLAAVYGARSDQAERAFGRLDQNRNGMLDAAELTAAITQFFASRDPRAHSKVAFGHA